jgi:hypothetical protein
MTELEIQSFVSRCAIQHQTLMLDWKMSNWQGLRLGHKFQWNQIEIQN